MSTLPRTKLWPYLEGLDEPDEAERRAILNHPDVALIERHALVAYVGGLRLTDKQRAIAATAVAELTFERRWCLPARALADSAGVKSKSHAYDVLVTLERRGLIGVERPGLCLATEEGPRQKPNRYWLTTPAEVPLSPYQRYSAAVIRLLISMGQPAAWAAALVRRGREGAGEILKYLRRALPGLLRSGHTRARARLHRLLSSVPWVRQLALPIGTHAAPPSPSGHRTRSYQSFKHERLSQGESEGERLARSQRAEPATSVADIIASFAAPRSIGAATGRTRSSAERPYGSATGRLRAQHLPSRDHPPAPPWHRPATGPTRDEQQARGASPPEVEHSDGV